MGKYAVLIGCNYPGGSSPLSGPCTDVLRLAQFLFSARGFDAATVLVDDFTLFTADNGDGENEDADSPKEGEEEAGELEDEQRTNQFSEQLEHEAAHLADNKNEEMTEEAQDHENSPIEFGWSTHNNILRAINWLVSHNEPGDELFFAYSGHGATGEDTSGTEKDGQMEYICPTDDKWISDDTLNIALIRPLKPGVTLHCLIDACHSGTVLDLPFQVKGTSKLNQWMQIEDPRTKGTSGGVAIQLSSCCDHQTSLDGGIEEGGLATRIFLASYMCALAEEEDGGEPCTYASVFRQMQLRARISAKETAARKSVFQESDSMTERAARLKDRMWASLHTGFAGKALARMASKNRTHMHFEGQVPVLAASEKMDLNTPFVL